MAFWFRPSVSCCLSFEEKPCVGFGGRRWQPRWVLFSNDEDFTVIHGALLPRLCFPFLYLHSGVFCVWLTCRWLINDLVFAEVDVGSIALIYHQRNIFSGRYCTVVLMRPQRVCTSRVFWLWRSSALGFINDWRYGVYAILFGGRCDGVVSLGMVPGASWQWLFPSVGT